MAFSLPDLPYDYDALEPNIDEQTMRIHHGKHHQGYTNKLNAAVEGTEWENKSIEDILRNFDSLPSDKKTAVRNNGGGFANHSLFWNVMSPNGGGQPSGALADAIDSAFGTFNDFKEKFSDAAKGQFGSGWGWLVVDGDGNLDVYGSPNQDSPYMKGHTPILGIDVWEHAYYLKYQNKRPDYVSNFWNVVDWDQVSKNYEAAK
ncbi:MAG: superoxide dismutase [Acidiferrobacterales bacterium]|nr:superoxide dismutase [Acidiferrobacterales bacterium]